MDEISNAAAILGRLGGSVKTAKGFSRLSPEGRAAMAAKGGQTRWAGKTREEQFWENVNKASGVFKMVNGELSECWTWTAGKSNKGYAYFSVNGKTKQAYKVAFEWEYGPVPDGLHIDHLCRTHECIRPDHLEAVTARVNTLRGETVTGKNSRKTACPKGHPYSGVNCLGGRICNICEASREARDRARRKEKARAL